MGRLLLKLLLVALAACLVGLGYELVVPLKPPPHAIVELPSGSSARQIAFTLQRTGVIRNAPSFLVWHYLTGRRTLEAGEYAFERPQSALQVYDRIHRGDIYFHTVVVPEGFNIFDIAAAVEAAGLGPRHAFLRAAQSDTSLISDIAPGAHSLEGFLFPDTYHFTRTQSMDQIVAAMVHRFRQEASAIGLIAVAPGQAFDPDLRRIVTIASIVEKETAVSDERPLVASVYYNRLARNIALAADPTVIYAALLVSRYAGTIYESDLRFDSPYNTYRHPGLPPGPIANPGRASLLAAMHPAQTDYFYFVSDNHGHHRFARTLAEHERNVLSYRRSVNGK